MGGTVTLAWTYLLGTRFRYLIGTTPFTTAKIIVGELPERPDTMAFVEGWEVEILTDRPGPHK